MYHQLIYRSRFRPNGSGAWSTMRDIVLASERNNQRLRITGYLIFDKTAFMQVLEGDENQVESTFDRIALDPRHDDLKVLARRPIVHRRFDGWNMGGSVRSAQTDSLFHRHPVDQDDPELAADAIVTLALEICDWENERQKMRGLSGR